MSHDPNFLQTLWFILIGVLWVGFFVLEGFDFGVGMLLRYVGRTNGEKRAVIHTIGPVWDGNEVWLLTAGGATFAAFPVWYASWFSGFYLALFLVLAALIIRGVSFEFWGKHDSPRWRAGWEWALAISSGAAALLFGVAWADLLYGVPMTATHNVTASLLDLLHPYALLGGLVSLSLFASHGAQFLTLRTRGAIEQRAQQATRGLSVTAAALTVAFLVWTVASQNHGGIKVAGLAVAILGAAAVIAVPLTRGVRAFALSAGAITLWITTILVELFPLAIADSSGRARGLFLDEASSSHYTLTVMSVVALIFVPVVLGYSAWAYWVFRGRLGGEDYGTPQARARGVLDRVAPERPDAPGAAH